MQRSLARRPIPIINGDDGFRRIDGGWAVTLENTGSGSGAEPANSASDRPEAAALLVARQGVYDRAKTVIAYELLYRRSAAAQTAEIVDGNQATLQVITNAVVEIGLDRLADDLPVHINYPRDLLVGPAPLPVHPQRVVIEVLENVRAEPEVLQGLATMRARGHRIALDDFALGVSDPGLLAVADIVKIDVSQHSPEQLAKLVAALKKRQLSLIAERVETAEEFERCHEVGFDAFQGYFLQHPRIFSSKPVPSSRLGTLRLVATLQSDDSSIKDIEQLISQDVSLSYRVLRCINSSYYNFNRKIDSIRQAIVILGFEKLRQLCALIALQGLEDRPPSVFIDAMTRARMCEQLGRVRQVRETPRLFITGLFSTLDALTGLPMAELLGALPLAPQVTHALTAHEGELGAILREVVAYERGIWNEADFAGISPEAVQDIYLEAVSWASATQAMVAG
jgi:EAL and modified HD-GYP domain-containing signal transduction protein